MKILILGTGPVASVLATSLHPDHTVVLASRALQEERRTVRSDRVALRSRSGSTRRSRVVEREARVVPLTEAEGDWDLVVSTAPPTTPEIAGVLARVNASAITAVTQVPSEVATLQQSAGERPWGLLVPGFLAWGGDPTRWWRMKSVFTATGSAATLTQRIFATRIPQTSTPDALLQAATMMPIVAGLQSTGFELPPTRQQVRQWAAAADEARRAVAAEHTLPAPRRISPLAVQGALTALPRLAPIDLRGYLRSHFGGHAEQTARLLNDWIDGAERHGLDSIVLKGLRNSLKMQEGSG